MRPRARRARAIVRDRRRGWFGIVPTLGPLTGFDLVLIDRYYTTRRPTEETRRTTDEEAPGSAHYLEPPRKP